MAQETTPNRTPAVLTSWAGAVRVRPAGETVSPAVKRYQYGVCGRRPRTSALTVWSAAAVAVTEPRATTREKALSSETSQATSVAGPRPEPGAASGTGVTRVHSRIPSGSGSPEATPCRKAGGGGGGRRVGGLGAESGERGQRGRCRGCQDDRTAARSSRVGRNGGEMTGHGRRYYCRV
ncbi:hypothetical protein GCM10020254_60780 [Streptomyces goshikiensis]